MELIIMDITSMFSQIFGDNGYLSHLYFEGMFTRTLTQDQVNKIPLVKPNLNNHDKSCIVCYVEFINNQLIRKTPCDHYFHKECLDKWLLTYNSICPVCRHKLE